ncbi:Fpg/Nei family DNA glycosylase [Cryptosporangium arvum]|uniref:DNA-(apurinic or apyrimidinic site) lyase n=1 Tax=Cryptosporangium arvum DSM 44712 TaxID=927661 RepID=A0A011AE87_9ACTN|nr:DNA-formamidopyrimidine glycosylase family protein [Cryptosporangium arvum]EXG80346.1 formamidopyrimidine-DNA glycosylase [Cryptosporangium arvum DSM 44712]
MPEGHTIHRLARRHKRLFGGAVVGASSPQGRFEAGAAGLDGLTLRGTDAHGKHLFHDYGDRWLHVHLGLYGTFTDGTGEPPAVRGQIRLRLTGGRKGPVWAELRGPTACEVLDDGARDALLARLGPDPLRPDAEPDLAWRRVSRSRTSIGALLMRQDVLSGVGNVYRAEALFRGGIDPYRAGRDVSRAEWDAVWDDLVVMMTDGVRAGRIRTLRPEHKLREPAGRGAGRYVYHRAARPCRLCGTPVRTAVVEGRNLFWCPLCQK